jgi:SPP1 family predicted phage head-tail adaptor
MVIHAGDLCHLLEVQAPYEVVDDHQQVVRIWTTVAERWSSIKPETGSERLEGQQTVARTRYLVKMHEFPGLSPSHRLIHQGRPFNIESVLEVDEANRETQCVCVETELETLQIDQLQGGSLTLNVLIGRPASTSARLRTVTPIEVEAHFEWGTTTQYLTGSTTAQVYQPLAKIDVDVTGLSAGVLYYYRLNYRRPGATVYETSTGSFRTARAPGIGFSFGVFTDGHMRAKLTGANYAGQEVYAQMLANIEAAGLDGVVVGGDTFHCEHYTEWNAPTFRDALRRHMYITGKWGSALSNGWLAFVLGNHEGEQLWRYNLDQELPGHARDARKRVIPNPTAAVTSDIGGTQGTDGENCFSWVSGDARFIVLDPYAFTAAQPHSRDGIEGSGDNWDWTLGEEQHSWLRSTLSANTSKWIFVFVHQIVGGVNTYGRGGIEAAKHSVAGNASYEWGGEDASGVNQYATKREGWVTTIHDALLGALRGESTLGVVVFMGHDHVGVIQTLDDIVYHHIGQPSDEDYGEGFYTAGGYANGEQEKNSHHVEVDVTSTTCTIKTIAAVRSGDTPGHGYANGDVMDQYVLS